MKILVIGPPGAGKGTQANKLSEEFDLPHLSAGQLLRDEVKKNTPEGQRAQPYIEKGQLVPVEIVVKIMKREMFETPGREGFIVDGFPRNLEQYEHLKNELDRTDNVIDVAIQLDVPEEEVIRRLSGRRICSECGRNYHVEFNPPNRENVCDKCGGELLHRSDDQPETIKERLKVYRDESLPVTRKLERNGVLKRVDASGSIEEVFERARRVVQNQKQKSLTE